MSKRTSHGLPGIYNSSSLTLTDGQGAALAVNENGQLILDPGSVGGGGNGSIADGVTASIKATVFDYTNANPLAVVLRDTNGDYVSVGGGTQYAEDTAHVSGDTVTLAGVVQQAADTALSNDGDRSLMQVDAAGRLKSNTVGSVAHDGVDAGAPVKIGGKAIAHGTNPTAVAAADRTDAYFNRHGIQFVIGGHPNPLRFCVNYTSAQTDTVLKAVGAGEKFVLTSYMITADNANSVDVAALLEFDAGTDTRIAEHPGIAKGSGFGEGNGGAILAVGGDAEDLLFTCEAPTGGSVSVNVTGYIIES